MRTPPTRVVRVGPEDADPDNYNVDGDNWTSANIFIVNWAEIPPVGSMWRRCKTDRKQKESISDSVKKL